MVHWFKLVLELNQTVRTSSEQFSSVQFRFSSGKTQMVQFTVQAKGGVNRTELNFGNPICYLI